MVSPPGPALQKINAALHREPLSIIFHGFFWCMFLLFWMPIAIVVLQVKTVWHLLEFWLGFGSRYPQYEPKKNPEFDMAVFVTGCDSGFGKDICIYAADAGFTVFAACLNEKSMKQFETVPLIIPLKLDVTDDKQAKQAVQIVSDWLQDKNIPAKDVGRKRVLHAVINNAGIGKLAEVDWMDLSDFQQIMDVNYFGVIRMVKAFLPVLKEQAFKHTHKGMRIINITSLAGLTYGAPTGAAYTASKHAAQAFTNCLRLELKAFNIDVSSVNPSFHDTPLVEPLDEMMSASWEKLPDEIKHQYGKAFFQSMSKIARFSSHRLMWNAAVVPEVILDSCLKAKRPPREVLVGLDTKILSTCSMVPAWVWDALMNIVIRRPVPEAMKAK